MESELYGDLESQLAPAVDVIRPVPVSTMNSGKARILGHMRLSRLTELIIILRLPFIILLLHTRYIEISNWFPLITQHPFSSASSLSELCRRLTVIDRIPFRRQLPKPPLMEHHEVDKKQAGVVDPKLHQLLDWTGEG